MGNPQAMAAVQKAMQNPKVHMYVYVLCKWIYVLVYTRTHTHAQMHTLTIYMSCCICVLCVCVCVYVFVRAYTCIAGLCTGVRVCVCECFTHTFCECFTHTGDVSARRNSKESGKRCKVSARP